MLIILMLILVVLFACVQQINNSLYVLDILCLDHFYFAGVPRIILFSRILHKHKSLIWLQPLPDEPLYLPLQQRLLLAENEFSLVLILS